MEKIKDIFLGLRSLLFLDKPGSWKVIILCIIGATTFWFFNALNKEYTTSISYPIEFNYNEEQYIAVKPLPKELQLNVSGGGWNLLRRANIFKINPIIITLQEPTEREKIAGSSLRGAIADQLDEFTVNFIITDSLSLDFERKIERKVAIKIDSQNISFRDNFRILGQIKTNKDSVVFTGPESMVNALQQPYLVQISENNLDSDFNEMVDIRTSAPSLIEVDPSEISVSFQVSEFVRMVKDFRAEEVNFPEDTTIYISDPFVTLSFMVVESMQNEITDDDFQVIADYDRMVASDSTIQPLIKKYPKGNVYDISIESGRLKVTHE